MWGLIVGVMCLSSRLFPPWLGIAVTIACSFSLLSATGFRGPSSCVGKGLPVAGTSVSGDNVDHFMSVPDTFPPTGLLCVLLWTPMVNRGH